MRAGAGQEAACSKASAWRRERHQLRQMLLDRSRVLTKETFNLVTQTSPVTLQKKQLWCDGGGVLIAQDGERKEQSAQRTSILF